MRLIDADRLLEERRMHTYYHLPNGDIAVPIVDIQHAPTVEERHTGEWDSNGECTVCRAHAPFWPMASTYYRSNFCPYCGARMKESKDV